MSSRPDNPASQPSTASVDTGDPAATRYGSTPLPADPAATRYSDDPLATRYAGSSAAAEKVPRSIPGYEILGEVDRGGMGVVYKARQVGFNRIVALKMILSGSHASPQERARFRVEAEAIARLQHPNIVQVYEVGEHEGKPFFSMEFCPDSLGKKLSGTPLPPIQAARLVETLSRAVHAAHLQNVIHRDLKPANVLLAADGTPKVSDFGLAKRTDAAGQTRCGELLGTPSYMAPEQASGNARGVGPATDVYALGTLLYECLIGRPPFRGPTDMETLMQVISGDPIAPRRLQPKMPRDLETICLKCLQKTPARRYPGADFLADDLRRFQAGEPVTARPVGWHEKAARWAKRRPAIAALLVAVILLTIGALSAIFWQLRETDLARRDADTNAKAYKTARDDALNAANQVKDALAKQDTALKQERTAREDREQHLYVAHMNLVQHHWQQADLPMVEALLNMHKPEPGKRDNRGFEWYYYQRMLHSSLHTLRELPGSIRSLAFSPKENLLAIACESGTVLLWDADSRKAPEVLCKESQPVVAVAFSPDGRQLAFSTAKMGEGGLVKLWSVAEHKERFVLRGHTQPVMGVAYSADGNLLASGSTELKSCSLGDALDAHGLDFVGLQGAEAQGFKARSGEIKLWNPQTGEELPGLKDAEGNAAKAEATLSLAFRGGDLWVGQLWGTKAYELASRRAIKGQSSRLSLGWSVAVHPRGESVVVASGWGEHGYTSYFSFYDGGLGWCGDIRLPAGVLACAYSPDGKTLAAGDMGRMVRLSDASTREETAILRGHTDAVSSLAFSHDGCLLATGSWDQTVQLWDLRTPQEWQKVYGNKDNMDIYARFSPDGKQLITQDNTVAKVWDTPRLTLRSTYSTVNAYYAFAGDGRLYGQSYDNGTVKLWMADEGPERAFCSFRTGPVDYVAVSPDLTCAVAIKQGKPPEVRLWSVASPGEPVTLSQEILSVSAEGY